MEICKRQLVAAHLQVCIQAQYATGLRRHFSNQAQVLVHGKFRLQYVTMHHALGIGAGQRHLPAQLAARFQHAARQSKIGVHAALAGNALHCHLALHVGGNIHRSGDAVQLEVGVGQAQFLDARRFGAQMPCNGKLHLQHAITHPLLPAMRQTCIGEPGRRWQHFHWSSAQLFGEPEGGTALTLQLQAREVAATHAVTGNAVKAQRPSARPRCGHGLFGLDLFNTAGYFVGPHLWKPQLLPQQRQQGNASTRTVCLDHPLRVSHMTMQFHTRQ